MPKEKQIYYEAYKKPYPEIETKYLPEIKHIEQDLEVVEAVIFKQGVVDREGEKLNFQDIRIYLKPNQ